VSYATLDQLKATAPAYQVALPDDPTAQRCLDLASHDLDAALIGTGPVDTTQLTQDQLDALTDACSIQACFRIQQGGDQMLGLDDGIASVAGISFSLRTPARLSPEAADRVAGMGLLRRSGCAPAPAPTVPTPDYP
jgi:hypothetical protein